MKIKLTSVSIDDYDKALKFYTEVLGFVKKHDIPLGEGARWITVVSPEEPDGTELLLEPNADYYVRVRAQNGDGNALSLTQENLAEMLGVCRSTVTVAAGALQKAGLIRYRRGAIEVLDRTRLETAACECYSTIRYRRLPTWTGEPSPSDSRKRPLSGTFG